MQYSEITLTPEHKLQFISITDKINDCLKKMKATNGLLYVFTRHTTTAILVNEDEPCLKKDLAENLKKNLLAFYNDHDSPEKRRQYNPETMNTECKNTDSHFWSILLPYFQVIPVCNGKLDLGTYQDILFLELDDPRSRMKFLNTKNLPIRKIVLIFNN